MIKTLKNREMNEEELNEITIACIQDERLRNILGRVLSMTEIEKDKFRKKISLFFLGKLSIEDLQVKKFFSIIAASDNAEIINDRIKSEIENEQHESEE